MLAPDLPEFHPIVQMLWEKSRIAARKMEGKPEPETRAEKKKSKKDMPNKREVDLVSSERTGESKAWHDTAARLERKATSQKNKNDVNAAIESTKMALQYRRAYLSKKQATSRSLPRAQQELAQTLVNLALLVLIVDLSKDAEVYFKEAEELYRASGMSKSEDCVLEIQRELERLKWKNKQLPTGRTR